MTDDSAVRSLTKQSLLALGASIVAIAVFPMLFLGRAVGLWTAPLVLVGLVFFLALAGSLVAATLGVWGLVKRGDVPWDNPNIRVRLVATAAGVLIAIPIFSFLHLAFTSPPIHDITTDTENPPQFVSVLPEREASGAVNSTLYDPEVGKLQREAYPGVVPLIVPLPADQAFRRALEAVESVGWRLVAAVPEDRRIEATDTTFWSGFVDDIIVRITSVSETDSRIDVRSVSRVGKSDIGKNAARIREYLEHLN